MENQRLPANPDPFPGLFNYTGDLPFSMFASGSRDFRNRVPGTYHITQADPGPDFELTSIECDDGSSATPSTWDLGSATATVELDPGETVRCRFTNIDLTTSPTDQGEFIAEARVAPGPDSGDFNVNFQAPCHSPDPVGLGNLNGPDHVCTSADPGTYLVTPIGPGPSFELTSIECDDGTSATPSTWDLGSPSATVELDPGEIVRCRFDYVDLRDPTIAQNVALTDQLPNGPGLAWSMDPPVPGCSIDSNSLRCAFGNLEGGDSVSVHVSSPTTIQSCGSYDNTAFALADNFSQIQASASTTVIECPSATLIVEKQTLPDADSAQFAFTGDASGTIGDGQTIVVPDLRPGTYSASETVPPGWDLTAIACTDADSTGDLPTATATLRLDAGEEVRCIFTNTKRGTVRVLKTVGGGMLSSIDSFGFELRQGASTASAGTILESGEANASGGGVINFTTFLTPGDTYQLCETVMPGWMTTLGPPFFTVFNPSGDNSTVCTDFTVGAGETKTFTIDNKPPPGGLARTIGFWKNWAACAGSKGNQKPVLDQTLQLGDITIGTLVLHDSNSDPNRASDCLQAVRLLNKSTINTGKKMASDPAFNLAAQLLAAKLNVQAGAGTCPAAVTAINDAQTLLAATHFNGITHDKMTANQTAQANALATTLDQYNNNALC